jgi:diaminopimelate epimerase
MTIEFYKYHATGNDFILLDNREGKYSSITQKQIAHMCHRRFGIGADGLMLLQKHNDANFEMVYYNSDGRTSSMCGNGGRCITAFARDLGIINDKAAFVAIDGLHHSSIDDNDVDLHMQNVEGITQDGEAFVLNTGSPHYIQFVEDASKIDVRKDGAAIRYNSTYAAQGINVNFVQVRADKTIVVATYERGVEDETYSCGTGVVASALVQIKNKIGANFIRVSTKGGTLMVKCMNQGNNKFTDILLCGPAQFVFTGSIEF